MSDNEIREEYNALQRKRYRARVARQRVTSELCSDYRELVSRWRALGSSMISALQASLSQSGYQPDEDVVNSWQGRLQELLVEEARLGSISASNK